MIANLLERHQRTFPKRSVNYISPDRAPKASVTSNRHWAWTSCARSRVILKRNGHRNRRRRLRNFLVAQRFLRMPTAFQESFTARASSKVMLRPAMLRTRTHVASLAVSNAAINNGSIKRRDECQTRQPPRAGQSG
jgi:hypothetical protein